MHKLRIHLKNYAFVIVALAFFYAFVNYLCFDNTCHEDVGFIVNAIGMMVFIAATGLHVLRCVKVDTASLWTPIAIFPVGAALYFGFGSMSTLFADEATQYLLQRSNYAITPNGLLRTNMLTMVGMATALIAMHFALRTNVGPSRSAMSYSFITNGMTAAAFLILGFILKYFFILPVDWGLSKTVIPGSFKTMGQLIDLGFATALYLGVKGNKKWLLIFWVLWPLHFGMSALTFSKKAALFAILLPAAGAFLAHRSWKKMFPWLLLAGISFASLQNLNTTGRLYILEQTGTISEAGFQERVDIVDRVLSGELNLLDFSSIAKAEAQVWWLRLNYSGQQLRAMELYDQGLVGEWELSLAQVLVPRLLWPDKPLAVSQGRIFNQTISGRDDARTRVGMSVYADGYWQMGWPGVFLFGGIVGLILGGVSKFTYQFVAYRQLIYFPVVFLALRMAALGQTGYLQKSYLGALPILIGYILVIELLRNVLRSSASRQRRVLDDKVSALQFERS